MKKIILLVLGIVFSIGTFAQTLVKGPMISFEEKSFDFGDVKQGQRVMHTFHYKNTGTDTLKIEYIAATGNCMASAYDKVVAPGASGSVRVEFDSAGRIGIANKTICIISNSISNNSQGDFLNIKVNIIL